MRWRNHNGSGASRLNCGRVIRHLLLCGISAAASFAGAQNAILSDFQSWDEVDVSARLSKNVDTSWVSQGRLSTEYPNPETYLSGIDLKLGIGRHLEITPSYYYLGAIGLTGRSGHFQVPMLTATVRNTWSRWTIADRNRFLGAIGGGNDFWIYVNRPRVDWRVGASSMGTTLFLWDEAFYFSLFHGWTRNRFAAGARKEFGKRWAADAYYLRQDDSRIQPRDLNGLGLTQIGRA